VWSTRSKECRKCGIVYGETRIKEESLKYLYNGYNSDRKKDPVLEMQRQIMYLKDYKFVMNSINKPPIRVLDVGCGNCGFLKLFKDSEKVGIEIDGSSYIEKDCTVYRSFDQVQDQKFDIIIFRGTLQYMYNLEKIQTFVDKYLSTEGTLAILALPNALSPNSQKRERWCLYNYGEHKTIFSLPVIKYMFKKYRVCNTEYPYINSPYCNIKKDLNSFVENIVYNNITKHAFWGNMLNVSLRKRISINKMFNTDKTYVIAEIGINHNGEMELARKLMDVAKEAKADCVKFQKRVVEKSFTAERLSKPYTTKNSWGPTYGKHKHHLEFDEKEFTLLRSYAKEIGIGFASTGCDKESVDFLDTLDMDFFKTASGDITNLPLLRHIASKGKPFVISTGMSDLDTLKTVVKDLDKINKNFAILICTSTYPSPPEDIHINNLDTFREQFPGKIIGYSGHERAYIPTLATVAKGAKIVERHITLDKTMRGSDHVGSLEPKEFIETIQAIRVVEHAPGTRVKEVRKSEKPFVEKLTKSLCTSKSLTKGHVLTEIDLVTKHPGTGVSPMLYDEVIGSVLTCDIKNDTILLEGDYE